MASGQAADGRDIGMGRLGHIGATIPIDSFAPLVRIRPGGPQRAHPRHLCLEDCLRRRRPCCKGESEGEKGGSLAEKEAPMSTRNLPPTSLRQYILSEIARIARERHGTPPGEEQFRTDTGISPARWRKYWPRWSAAVLEAGLTPNTPTPRIARDEILAAVAEVFRQHGRIPTETEIELARARNLSIPGRSTMRRHFPRKTDLVRALAGWAAEDPARADVAELLPALSDFEGAAKDRGHRGFVYLLRYGGDFKIGRSGDLERRIRSIGVSMPERLELVHSIRTDDPSGIEAYWHRRFAERRRNGEWFQLTRADVAAFRRRQYQ